MLHHPLRLFWFSVGCLSVALGAIGVVLPVLPTTPFAILAVFAFGKSSPVLERKLMESRVFGPIIADWRRHGVIAIRYKVIAHTMMTAALVVSIAASIPPMVLVFQVLCMGGASAFILTRPSHPASDQDS